MKARSTSLAALILPAALVLASGGARAAVVEEIVAWVNGDIITKSDYDEEEQLLIADAYKRLSGPEFDEQLQQLRHSLLGRMIDRKILVDQAQRLFRMEHMGEVFLKSFKEQQKITSDAELAKLLEQEGMTVEDVKQKLIEMFAPDEVIRYEVDSRVAVSDAEIAAFYAENRAKVTEPARVTLREIVLRADSDSARKARRDEAEAIRKRVVAGEDFAKLASELSEAGTRSDGGLVGTLKKDDLAAYLLEPAFALPVGDVSEVIETPHGLHLVKVESRVEEHAKPLEEVREEVRRAVHDAKLARELNAYLDKVRAESQWCVKPQYEKLLSYPAKSGCENL